ncbi:LytTR family DNA-binding domain-containing protein [Aurantiacibacter sediminis]|uniref:LytTR family transcriptional regulator DNA-binding domain-containing protein n=1 Tax=Aurantiacibacter sediminis TaxID=2793064 RepID=A0ABS0MZ86_9SPHN|nr:LytTR family DNA-binding domain-containing protein [Aurantiacibacter sediminis]MBH5321021.1 LytTR family transcriptional regulator DNA-binding domain-containing protein [Aurantiacibacter sediminis]
MSTSTPRDQKPFVSRLLVDLATMVAIGVVLALIGPFGSFNDPLPIRLVVWIGFAVLGYALYAPIDTLAQRLAPILQLPAWALRIAGVLISSVPMAAVVWMIQRGPERWGWPGLDVAMTHYVYVAMIGALIALANQLIQRQAQPSVEPASTPSTIVSQTETPSPARFLDRLPPELGTQLIALEMEDHYVRAYTALGSELVLLRMRDAVAELDGMEGEQVHRSWWVARGSVADVKREGRNVRLVLDNGIEAPVSRANVAPLKDAGWF